MGHEEDVIIGYIECGYMKFTKLYLDTDKILDH
jgi:hypothetical protein